MMALIPLGSCKYPRTNCQVGMVKSSAIYRPK
jgi:hypothetical protein